MSDLALGKSPKRVRLLGALTGAGLVLAGVGAYVLVQHLGTSGGSQAVAANAPPVVTHSGLQRVSGVRVVHVAVTGDGGLVDLRYQVIDPDRAASVHEAPPELVDEQTGVVVDQLFMGHSHTGRYKAAQTYYLIFTNPGNLVRRGTKVTVVLGHARLPHVRVQ